MEKSVMEKQPEVIRQMFSQIAPRYDLANEVLSMGIHRRWRRQVVAWSEARPGQKILDCATGTGDLAIEFKHAVGIDGYVLGTDFCREMLEYGPSKARTAKLHVQFEVADVMNLPYQNESFNVASISFGIRNVSDPEKAIQELSRVTKSGGAVMILEFGKLKPSFWTSLFGFYSSHVLPKLGGWLTGQSGAYSYLEKSSREFPSGEEFKGLLEKNGNFKSVEYRALTGGVAYLYKCVKN